MPKPKGSDKKRNNARISSFLELARSAHDVTKPRRSIQVKASKKRARRTGKKIHYYNSSKLKKDNQYKCIDGMFRCNLCGMGGYAGMMSIRTHKTKSCEHDLRLAESNA